MIIKVIKIYIYIIIIQFYFGSISLLSQPVFALGPFMVGENRFETKKDGEKEIFQSTKKTDSYFRAWINANDANHKYEYNIQTMFITNLTDPKRNYLTFGDQNYISMKWRNTSFVFGRKLQNFSNLLFPSAKDGSEGFSIEYKVNEKFQLQMDLLDYYRGFPNQYLIVLWDTKEKNLQTGNRFRNTIQLEYTDQYQTLGIYFKYLNLGNWGLSSLDNQKQNPLSDSDFVYHMGFQYQYNFAHWELGVGAIISRGLDKTNFHEIRKNSSLPISGELLKASVGFKIQGFKINYRIFLPDRDKKNSSKEVLETGFIGMGLNPGSGIILPYIINFFPSGWVSMEGMERKENIVQGRLSSLLNELEISYSAEDWKIGIFGSHYTPYRDQQNNGEIGLKRNEFTRLYLVESGIYGEMGKKAIGNYFLRVIISHLNTSRELGIRSTAGFLEAGVYF